MGQRGQGNRQGKEEMTRRKTTSSHAGPRRSRKTDTPTPEPSGHTSSTPHTALSTVSPPPHPSLLAGVSTCTWPRVAHGWEQMHECPEDRLSPAALRVFWQNRFPTGNPVQEPTVTWFSHLTGENALQMSLPSTRPGQKQPHPCSLWLGFSSFVLF